MKVVAVVNNEKHIADWVRMNLEAEGIRVCVYYRGIDALAVLIEEPPDLIMLDNYNPPLGGVPLLRKLREHCETPVIFLTPHAEDIAAELRGTALDAADYIATPVLMTEMVERVKAVLNRSENT